MLSPRILAKSSSTTVAPQCVVILTTDPVQLWLANFGSVTADVGPGELFGFNVGGFVDKPQGARLNYHGGAKNYIFFCFGCCKTALLYNIS